MREFIVNDIFYGIVSRQEVEEILKNNSNEDLKNVILISITNPLSDKEIYEMAINELKQQKDVYEIPIKKQHGKFEKKIGTKEDLKKFIQYLEEKFEKMRKGGLDDINSFPIDGKLLSRLKDNINVSFWDIEEKIGNYEPINDEQAYEIAKFINKYKNEIGNGIKVLIHCSAGISRSAGVGLAVKCIVKHNGDKHDFSLFPCEITQLKRYYPNLVVYDKIVEQYNKHFK